jgi:CDP-glucose 4,6-dehydratase
MADPFGGFYRNRRGLITGHTRLKGSWLAQGLLELGAIFRGYSLPSPTSPPPFQILRLAEHVDHCEGDILDLARMQAAIADFKPDVLFHLAAQPLVRTSYKDPRLTFETNVLGTLNVYESVRACGGVGAVVCITTDKCYENREWAWGYRETDNLGGRDPYSASKACVELLSVAYRHSYFAHPSAEHVRKTVLSTARAGNVIGGGDWAQNRLIPDCVRALAKGEKIRIRNPDSIRPWQHVLEPLSGYLLVAQRTFDEPTSPGEAWNFGPGDRGTISVENIVQHVIAEWGRGEYCIDQDSALHEAKMLTLDISKARHQLGWTPRWGIDEAVRRTVEVYAAYYREPESVREAVRAQIGEYAALLMGGK